MLTLSTLKKFFSLLKIKQQPHEDFLTAAIQSKVDQIKKYNSYNLNDRQRETLGKDKTLIRAVDSYVGIQHEIITHLFQKLEAAAAEIEGLKTDAAALYADKLTAEKALTDYIQQNEARKIYPAA